MSARKNRQILALVMVLALLVAPRTGDAQQPEKIARVGFLLFGPAEPPEVQARRSKGPLWPARKELGWVYGTNILAERRWGESIDQLRTAAADLVRLKVDVVVVGSASLAKIVQLESTVVPIVVSYSGIDLVSSGLAASLANPGGTVTGLQILNDETIGKRFEVLKALVPNLSRVAWLRDDVVWSAIAGVQARYDQQGAEAARTLGLRLHPLVVHQPEEFAAAFLSMKQNRDQGLVAVGSPFMAVHRKAVIELAAKHRIPTVYDARADVDAGGLMSYGASGPEIFRRLAYYLDKILRGAKLGNLPIEQITKVEFVINLKTARALGLTIPSSLLGRADEIIQ